ncbi:MAG: hypothetical protein K2G13_00025, partial [Muribaculaceae bacterium]|nr:hypothetical protein [Muribaculaceae bacterium]
IKPKPQASKKKNQNKKKPGKKDDRGNSDKGLPNDSVPGLMSDSIAGGLKEGIVDNRDGGKEKKDNEDTTEDEEKPAVPTFSFNAKGPDNDIRRPLAIEVPVPLMSLDTMAFRLEVKPDSVWTRVKGNYKMERTDSLSERKFKIEYPWERGMTYRVIADSLAATDIYGVQSEKLEYEFKTKAADDLSNLKLVLNGLEPGIPAFVELIASGDKPKYSAPVVDGVAKFDGIDAGKYYARLYEDFNGDGKYSTGSYRLQKIFGVPNDTVVGNLLEMDRDSTLTTEVIIPEAVGLPVDSIVVEAKDSLVSTLLPADSLAGIANDSILVTENIAVKIFQRPMSDKEITDSLRRAGYSLSPIETDSVGQDFLIAIQPDYVYYYPKTINVKKNWDVEQTWNVFETALDLQKPDKLKKNKPKRNNQQRQEEEEEEDDDEFGANPFAPNRNNNRNGNYRNTNRNNQGNTRLRMQN